MKSATLDKFEYGFRACVKAANPKCELTENVISSTVKNINVSIVNLVGEILDGNYQGGQVIVNTLASGGVGLSDSTKDHVSKDILDYVNEQADKIKSGEIKVPENEKQYNEIVGK